MTSTIKIIKSNRDMERSYVDTSRELLAQEGFDRGEVHAQKTTTPEMITRELRHVIQRFQVPQGLGDWQDVVVPNLPWAEDHFQERVSGVPLNPPPSHEWWPFNRKGNEEHLINEKFSHSYPERFWPKFANVGGTTDQGRVIAVPIVGVRFEYGDLRDLVEVLLRNPRSRQAYLPVWFPEDLVAADSGQRVPCTLGYHFQLAPDNRLDCSYFMRSCDFVRFYRDDVYMAGRLLQWVAEQILVEPGDLILHTANLHCFVGDYSFLKTKIQSHDPRAGYDFGGLM